MRKILISRSFSRSSVSLCLHILLTYIYDTRILTISKSRNIDLRRRPSRKSTSILSLFSFFFFFYLFFSFLFTFEEINYYACTLEGHWRRRTRRSATLAVERSVYPCCKSLSDTSKPLGGHRNRSSGNIFPCNSTRPIHSPLSLSCRVELLKKTHDWTVQCTVIT